MNEEVEKRNKELNVMNKKNNKAVNNRPLKRELKTKEEILKERKEKERRKNFQNWRKNEKSKRKGKSHNHNKSFKKNNKR